MNFEEFSKEAGLIKTEEAATEFKKKYGEDLREAGLFEEIDECGFINDFRNLKWIDMFLEKHPELHLAAQAFEGATEYWTNYPCYVNRVAYVFATGSQDVNLYYE